MFKIGDKVHDTEIPSSGTETVKEVKQVWVIRTNEWPSMELPAERFELAFPREGARVRDKLTGELATVEECGHGKSWFVNLDGAGILNVPADYVLAHYEEVTFPYVGARFVRKAPQPYLFNEGVITHVYETDGVRIRWDGADDTYTFTSRDFREMFKEG